MEKFDKVIQDAERHLEAAEKSSIDLARRIQEVSKACAVAEVDVEKSTAAIASSEKRLSILAHQQSDTRKRLSALYRSLIAIPSVTAKVGDNSMSALGVVDVSVVSSSSTAQDLAILQCCFFNSLISTSNIDTLVRHTHFIHAELRLDRGIDIKIGPHLPPGDNSLLSDGSARNNEKFSIDPMTPLCMFALTGGCKNKTCCFQHLDENDSDKKKRQKATTFSSTNRSWRSLKLQQRLKLNINKAGARRVSDEDTDLDAAITATETEDDSNMEMDIDDAVPPSADEEKISTSPLADGVVEVEVDDDHDGGDDSSDICDGGDNVDSGETVAVSTDESFTSKRRYFQISQQEDSETPAGPDYQSADNPQVFVDAVDRLIWHPDFAAVISHCHALWASCQPEAVCSCMYQCLHIDSGPDLDLLPFGVTGLSEAVVVPPELQSFVNTPRSREEEGVLYACLVSLLMTGDFVGPAMLAGGEMAGGAHLDGGIFVIPPSRALRYVRQLQRVLVHAPQFFQKVIFLLQRAHHALTTSVEIEYASNYLHVPTKFSLSCSSSSEGVDHSGIGTENDSSSEHASLPHRVIWMCTSIVAEVCCNATDTAARPSSKHATWLSSAVLLTRLYSATLSCDAASLRDTSESEPFYFGDESSRASISHVATNINFRFMISTLSLMQLSENRQSNVSLFQESSRYFPSSISLALATSSFSSRRIELEGLVELLLEVVSDSKEACEAPSAVFSVGDQTWALSVKEASSAEGSNTVSSRTGSDNKSCHITLLAVQHDHEHSDSDSDTDGASGLDEESACDSDSGESNGASASGKAQHVLSKIEINHMLREFFVDIFSVRCGTTHGQLDVNVIISLWLCVGNLCSIFDTPHCHTSRTTNEHHLKTSNDNNKAIKRFFCNALVIHRNIVAARESSGDLLAGSMGAAVLRMLLLFCSERIERIVLDAEAGTGEADVNAKKNWVEAVDQSVCALLSLAVSVLVTVLHSGNSSATITHNKSAVQVTLASITSKLKDKKLFTFRHAHHILCLIQQGSHCGPAHHKQKRADEWKGMGDLMGNLADFYVLFPPQSFLLMRKCFSTLLSSDIFDLCFELLDVEASAIRGQASPFFLHENDPNVELICVRMSQCLNIQDIVSTTLQSLAPGALFQLAMVYFIAENFDALLIVQRFLLNMKHPCAMFHFARVFSMCFAAESLLAQAEVIREVCDMYSLNQSSFSRGPSDGAAQWKRRRELSESTQLARRETYLSEEISLLDQFSADSLVHLSGILTASTSSVTSSSQMQISTTDVSNFTIHGRLPASLTVLADTKTQSPVANLNVSHNSLRHFPLVVLGISSLMRLDLAWNSLSSLPTGIRSLVNLQVLDISHNEFTYFPSSVLKLSGSLLELYLQDNKIEEIRNDFLKLARLEVLDVSNNRLHNVPSRLNDHMKLKFFRFSGNPVFDVVSAQQPMQNLLGKKALQFSSASCVNVRPKTTPRIRSHSRR